MMQENVKNLLLKKQWMGWWMDGGKSHFKDCLQQTKIDGNGNLSQACHTS